MTPAPTEEGTKPTANDTEQAFRFLDLPPEIWLSICRLAVIQGTIIVERPNSKTNTEVSVAQPALSRTCKVLRAETLKLFYGENEFRLIDNGKIVELGIRGWAKAVWSTWWPLIKTTTVQSHRADIIDYLKSEMWIMFDEKAPTDSTTKILRFKVKGLHARTCEEGGCDAECG